MIPWKKNLIFFCQCLTSSNALKVGHSQSKYTLPLPQMGAYCGKARLLEHDPACKIPL